MSYDDKYVHIFEAANASQMDNVASMIKSRIDPTINSKKKHELIFIGQINE